MMSWLFIFMLIAMFLALGSLVLGIITMVRNKGLEDSRRSNRFMQWRLYMQALALVFLVLAFIFFKQH